MESDIAIEGYDKYYKVMRKKWEPKGSIQLLPGEVHNLQHLLCSTNDIFDLQVFTMVLLGIKCFLRADELLDIELKDFDEKYSQVTDEGVQSLVLKVNGKSDEKDIHLVVFRDDECTHFCPIRHLLIYLACTGINSGYLFPNKYELSLLSEVSTHINKSTNQSTRIWKKADRHAYTKWKYETWLEKIKELCVKKLKRDINGYATCGTHTLRKTG
jgi:integrase